MDFSMNEALGFAVAIVCVSIVIFSLYNVGFFKGISSFITAVTQNKVVNVTYNPSAHSDDTSEESDEGSVADSDDNINNDSSDISDNGNDSAISDEATDNGDNSSYGSGDDNINIGYDELSVTE